jgi:alpha-amylase/alpha-mannosidase (GH57 family)
LGLERGRPARPGPSIFLCVHGHFYQPPREDPSSGKVPPEAGAAPYHDFNEKVAAECYGPNAALGNFSRLSFDLGPTLASWLERNDRRTYRRILAQERSHLRRYGCSNALAQVYSHVIMPLASEREKRIQVAWGLADYRHRFQHEAAGIWLAETAADSATMAVLADFDVGFTVLAPWQAGEPIDPSEPYVVRLADGRAITVFFFSGDLSGGVSFDPALTTDADSFAASVLPRHLSREKLAAGAPQLLLIATDGELYGHHQPLRQHFLSHLLRRAGRKAGFEVTSLPRFLQNNQPRREVKLIEPGSWSCFHGVERWRGDCACTEGDGRWKGHLRQALRNLAERLDTLYEVEGRILVQDPWAVEENYILVKLGILSWAAFWRRHARDPRPGAGEERAAALLEGQYYRHLMFASCAFYFEDLDRIEPRIAIANGLRALRAWPPGPQQRELETAFANDLASARSWRGGRSGADLLAETAQRETGELVGRACAARRSS